MTKRKKKIISNEDVSHNLYYLPDYLDYCVESIYDKYTKNDIIDLKSFDQWMDFKNIKLKKMKKVVNINPN